MYNFVPMYHLAFKRLEKRNIIVFFDGEYKKDMKKIQKKMYNYIYLFICKFVMIVSFFFFFNYLIIVRSIRSKEKKKNVIVLSKIKSFIICAIFKKHIISKYLSKTYNKYLHVCTRDGIYCRLIIDYLWFRKQHLETLVSTF